MTFENAANVAAPIGRMVGSIPCKTAFNQAFATIAIKVNKTTMFKIFILIIIN